MKNWKATRKVLKGLLKVDNSVWKARETAKHTNMFHLSYNVTRNFDFMWSEADGDGGNATFVERCKRILRVGRIRAHGFNQITAGLQQWPGWRQAIETYMTSLPQYHNIVEYFVRILFKILYGDDHAVMFEWFVRSY